MSLINIRRVSRLAHLGAAMTVIALVSACFGSGSTLPPTYTLGGTVSGLNTSGLVLAREGQTVTVSSGASSFTFGSVLTSGSTYAVTVQSQPAGQLCTVSNGSGTAATANVANVVVACSEKAYSVGGMVSGLTSSGLVLANGSDTLSVAPSATTFTLTTPVAKGSSYSVTVRAQPTGLACAVTKGTGTMATGNVKSVVVSCTDQPFSLGGSISGLTTSGLVLANGSDTRDVDANATSFTMPTAVPYDSAYAVTVRTQPTGLSCTVTHDSGTMPAAAVTRVAVTCADQTYTLGGTISGLTAGGLVLANGTDTLTVNANATSFTMPTAIPYGSPYAVTVQTQPAALTCTPGNATGTMPAHPVATVVITCAVNTYTIGGSISGLTTSGLVLANGSDTTPPLGATATMFTMPTGVASGSTYNVSVQTQPAGQLCTVSNGSGPVATSDVTTVAVSCSSNVVSYTVSGSYSWPVPDGVTSIQVVATGGGGGGNSFNYGGGNGGVVTGSLSVTAGNTLALFVGGGGSNPGLSTGGGGGSSNVDAGTSNQIIAGGGGGAGGSAGGPATGGDGGGNGTGNGSNGNGGNPTNGGGGSGGTGGAGGISGVNPPGIPPPTFGAGAAGGNGNGGPGGAGGSGGAGGMGSGTGAGGAGGNACCGGGGGGGYGGGGGAGSGPFGDGGGGGGGSTGPTGATFTVGANGGVVGANGDDGSIVITTNP